MTSQPSDSERTAVLLEALLMRSDIDDTIGAQLTELENSSNNLVQLACHQARHFIADRDIHLRDQQYAEKQLAVIRGLIGRLQV
jgi:hypothetical protein